MKRVRTCIGFRFVYVIFLKLRFVLHYYYVLQNYLAKLLLYLTAVCDYC